MSFETFDQVIHFFGQFTNLEQKTDRYTERTYRLDRMRALMEHLGNPQNSYKIIHVAGSKGKGSTSSFLAKAIEAAGFKCGLYMSPHVSDYRERFTLSGRFFKDCELISAANTLEKSLLSFHFSDDELENHPTTFEVYTAYAFILFKETVCQWAVIETGLGGRLDATNIVTPKASVLTPIELEHTDILGNTLTQIASEKSKIIKLSVPSFTAFQQEEVLNVFRKEASEQKSELTELSDCIVSLNSESTVDYQKLELQLSDGYKANLRLKMIGDVQAYNCALALTVLRKLGLYREQITEKALEDNVIPGRMEKIPFSRPLYLDGAHTKQSVKHLMVSFRQMYRDGVCIFGSVEGKNHEAMAEDVLKNFDTIIISKPGTFKKSDPKALFELFSKMKTTQQVYFEEDMKKALSLAESLTTETQPILCCGSFYLAGQVKEALCL